jgi:gas vesicle protein
MADRNGGAEFFAGLVIGGLVGATLALLLAPQSGEETRAQIRDKSLDLKSRAEEGYLEARQIAEKQMASLQEQVTTLQEQVSTLQEKGKEAYEKGKESVAQAVSRTKSGAQSKG